MKETISVLEITSAYRRVESRYRVRERKLDARLWMKWFIDFTQANFSLFSEGDWLNCRHELNAFLVFMAGRGKVERSQVITGYPLFSVNETKHAQQKVKDKLTEFLKSDSVAFGSFTIKLYLIRGKNGQWLVEDIENAAQKLFYYTAILLERYGDKILRCPECARLFLADRKDQKFDKVRCQDRLSKRLLRKKQTNSIKS